MEIIRKFLDCMLFNNTFNLSLPRVSSDFFQERNVWIFKYFFLNSTPPPYVTNVRSCDQCSWVPFFNICFQFWESCNSWLRSLKKKLFVIRPCSGYNDCTLIFVIGSELELIYPNSHPPSMISSPVANHHSSATMRQLPLSVTNRQSSVVSHVISVKLKSLVTQTSQQSSGYKLFVVSHQPSLVVRSGDHHQSESSIISYQSSWDRTVIAGESPVIAHPQTVINIFLGDKVLLSWWKRTYSKNKEVYLLVTVVTVVAW